MAYTLPPLPLSPSSLQEVLDHLFEPSPTLRRIVAASSFPLESYDMLADHVATLLFTLTDEAALLQILGSHPRLGAKVVESVHSRSEQKSLAEGDEDGGAEKLVGLNREYEATFPGLRYVVFVNGRSLAVVMEDMRSRIDRGDFEAEKRAAIEAMRNIAKARASKLSSLRL